MSPDDDGDDDDSRSRASTIVETDNITVETDNIIEEGSSGTASSYVTKEKDSAVQVEEGNFPLEDEQSHSTELSLYTEILSDRNVYYDTTKTLARIAATIRQTTTTRAALSTLVELVTGQQKDASAFPHTVLPRKDCS
jgi:hypothetical protein